MPAAFSFLGLPISRQQKKPERLSTVAAVPTCSALPRNQTRCLSSSQACNPPDDTTW